MKALKIVFLLLMAVLLALPITGFNWQTHYVSELNNALLTELDVSEGLDPSNLDAFIGDRIGLHDEAVTGNIYLNNTLFGELTHPTYTYGKDGYVFFEMENNHVDVDFIDAFCRYLRLMQNYCEQRGVPFVYCLNPSKSTVYQEYLPEGYLYKNDFLNTMYARLELYGVNWISSVEMLEEKAKTEQVYNVQYDAGHWNDLGQFYGANYLLEKIASYFPAVQLRQMSEFSITTKIEPYLPNSRVAINEEVPVFTCLQDENLENITEWYAGLRMDSRYKTMACFRRTDEEAETLPRVLFFHGSYYNRNRQFYSCSFQETYAIHNYQNILNLDYYFNIFQPDCVILETAEYATTSYYFEYENLLNKQFNPVLEKVIGRPHFEYTLEAMEPEFEVSGQLCAMSFSIDQPYVIGFSEKSYSYGYLVADDMVMDLELDGYTAYCTVDLSRVNLDNATVYLFIKK